VLSSRAIILVLCLAAPAMAQVKLDAATREALSWQIALEREGFSPGIIDGKPGPKLALAKAEFAKRSELTDSAMREALASPSGSRCRPIRLRRRMWRK